MVAPSGSCSSSTLPYADPRTTPSQSPLSDAMSSSVASRSAMSRFSTVVIAPLQRPHPAQHSERLAGAAVGQERAISPRRIPAAGADVGSGRRRGDLLAGDDDDFDLDPVAGKGLRKVGE